MNFRMTHWTGGRGAPRSKQWGLRHVARAAAGIAAAGLVVVSLVCGMLAGAIVAASAASAATHPACTPTSTSTCSFTLKIPSGTWAAQNATPPTSFTATTSKATFAGSETGTRALSGTLTLPTTTEHTEGSTTHFTFVEFTPGSAHGQVKTTGNVTLTDVLQINFHATALGGSITIQCVSKPLDVTFNSTGFYNPATGGGVTLVAKTFTIPEFVPGNGSCTLAAGTLNKSVAGSVGNKIIAKLSGVLAAPSTTPPTRTTVTTLTASPAGSNVAGQTTTLTATVAPSSAIGHVAFFTGTTKLGTVTLSGGVASYKTKTLPPGTDHLKATYSGNATYKPSAGTLTYTVSGTPAFTINYPQSMLQGAAPTEFAGVVSDPVGGPTLPNVRLNFTLKGVSRLNHTELPLIVCTKPTYAATSCTANILTGSSTLKGVYGGAGGNSGFSLTPGQQIPLYFELSTPIGAPFGVLTATTSLVTVTSGGTKVLATLGNTKPQIDLLSPTSPQTTTLTTTVSAAGTDETYQGYNVTIQGNFHYSTITGPTPGGTVTVGLTTTVTGTPTSTSVGAFTVSSTRVYLTLGTAAWPVGKSKVTLVYSGNIFFHPTTAPSVTFTVLPAPVGGRFACKWTLVGIEHGTDSAYLTGFTTVTLPSSALAGSTIHTGFASKMAIDATTTWWSNFVNDAPTGVKNTFGLSPSGTATTGFPNGTPSMSTVEGVAIDPSTHTLYAAASGSHAVGVITTSTNTVVSAIPVSGVPHDVAFDPTNHLVYVATSQTGAPGVLATVTTTSNTVVGTPIDVGGYPISEALNPATHTLYVATTTTAVLRVVTTSDNLVGSPITVKNGAGRRGIAVNSKTNKIYLANYNQTSLTIVTGASSSLTTIATNTAKGVAVNEATNTIYVGSRTTLVAVTGASNTVEKTVELTSDVRNVEFDASTNTIEVVTTATTSGLLELVTPSTYSVKSTGVELGTVTSLVLGPTSGDLYVAGRSSMTIVSGGTSPKVIASIQLLPWSVTAKNPLTASVSILAGGTITLPNTSGTTSVGVSSFHSAITLTGFGLSLTCTEVSAPPAIGKVNVLPRTKPAVTSQPQSKTVNAGQTATFSSSATAAPAPTVEWQSSTNGTTWKDVGAGETMTTAGTVTTSFTTPKTTATDNGTEYRAVFTNTSGTTPSTAATLTVNVAPTVTSQPANQTVTAGQPVSFTAAGAGRPTPTVQWQVSTDGGKTFSNVPGANATTLSFTSSSTQSGNQYRAVFKNSLGTAASTAATLTVTTTSYRLAGSDGSVFSFGTAGFYGSMGGQPLNKPIVGMAATPDNKGYWLVASDGGIFSFGDAQFYGSMGGQPLNQPIVGMAATPTGKGYWEVASDGGIFAFGAAQFYGSMGGKLLNKPVVAMAATPTGKGYWEVASDGGIFAFGSAQFHGSTGSMTLNQPIVSMAPTAKGDGYWLVASDGGIFAFGSAPFYGSTGGAPISGSVVGMAATTDGEGYWLAGSNGAVYNFGDAPLAGSAVGLTSAPIVGITR